MRQYSDWDDARWQELQASIRRDVDGLLSSDPVERLAYLKLSIKQLAQLRSSVMSNPYCRASTVRMLNRRITAVSHAIKRWKKKAALKVAVNEEDSGT